MSSFPSPETQSISCCIKLSCLVNQEQFLNLLKIWKFLSLFLSHCLDPSKRVLTVILFLNNFSQAPEPSLSSVCGLPYKLKVLARTLLLSQPLKNHPSSISDQVPHPSPFSRWCLITLAYLEQESCEVSFLLAVFPSTGLQIAPWL